MSLPHPQARIAKAFLDSGREATLEAAVRRLSRRPLQIVLPSNVAGSETLQLCAMIATETGARCFPGGVRVVLSRDGAFLGGWNSHAMLSSVLAAAGATLCEKPDLGLPTIIVGTGMSDLVVAPRSVVAIPRGWAGGVVPATFAPLAAAPGVLGAVLAGSIAVSELFLAEHDFEPGAATRATGISSWAPEVAWTDPEAIGPEVELLPRDAWLVGLGHLGQAMAWLLRALPYSDPGEVLVGLQDTDVTSVENIGTSLLASRDLIGVRKVRAVQYALEARGYRTTLVERRMDGSQTRQSGEPRFGVAGLDSPSARRPLSAVGWVPLLDAGLGAGADDFTQIAVRRLGESLRSEDVFAVPDEHRGEKLLEVQAYREQLRANGDRCGVVQAAGRAVGASFVGAVAAVLTLGEAIRPLHEGPSCDLLSLDLRDLSAAQVAYSTESAAWPPATPARRLFEEYP